MGDNIPKIIHICDKNLFYIQKKYILWKKLNPDYDIRLYDDRLCENFLETNFGKIFKTIFRRIKDGPIKADFFRVCVLYIEGGVYTDADNLPLVPIESFLEKDIDLLTCSTYWNNKIQFNPNFIMCKKNNKLIEKCIKTYIFMVKNNIKYSYWGWSIMNIFTINIKLLNYNKKYGIFIEKNTNYKVQILQEIKGRTHNEDHNIYQNKIIFKNRSNDWNVDTHQPKK